MDKALVFSELAPNVKCAIFPDGMCLMYPDGEPDSSGNVVMKCSAEQPERVLAGWGQGPWDWKASVAAEMRPLCALRFIKFTIHGTCNIHHSSTTSFIEHALPATCDVHEACIYTPHASCIEHARPEVSS